MAKSPYLNNFFYCHPFANVSTTMGICKVPFFFLPHQFLRSQKPLDSSLREERKPPENAGSASSLWRATKMLWIVHAIRDKNRSTLNKRFLFQYSWLATMWQGSPVGGQYNGIFSQRIYMKIRYNSQRRKMLSFLTLTHHTNMACMMSIANQQL